MTVTPRNAVDKGPTARLAVPDHFAGGVRAASVKRNHAIFTGRPPAQRGTQLFWAFRLVRKSDDKAVRTGSLSPNRSKAAMSYRFYDLAKTRAYALRVAVSSAWGSCAAETGGTLLPAAK